MSPVMQVLHSILDGYQDEAPILADWVEDTQTKECMLYSARLRKPAYLRIQTAIDLVYKFGEPKERRSIQRIIQVILWFGPPHVAMLERICNNLDDLTSLKSRHYINITITNISGTTGKNRRQIKARFKHQEVIGNSNWFMYLFRLYVRKYCS